MLAKLKRLQDAAGVINVAPQCQAYSENEAEFDDIGEAESDVIGGPPQARSVDQDQTVIERHILALPSNGNVGPETRDLEIHHQTIQARSQVNWLRDIIADISFQYSHVIRGQVQKSVRMAAQTSAKVACHNIALPPILWSYNLRIALQ